MSLSLEPGLEHISAIPSQLVPLFLWFILVINIRAHIFHRKEFKIKLLGFFFFSCLATADIFLSFCLSLPDKKWCLLVCPSSFLHWLTLHCCLRCRIYLTALVISTVRIRLVQQCYQIMAASFPQRDKTILSLRNPSPFFLPLPPAYI